MTNENNQLQLLDIRNETFVREVSYHPELASTNVTAIELAQQSSETPLLVIADRQTAGKGRGGNSWWSSEGALTFTLVLDLPMLSPEELSSFSLTTGLAVCQTLEQFAPMADLAIKWPNDVYMNERKVCGILIERPVASEPQLAIGVGININNSLADAPPELQGKATSVKDQLESELSLSLVLTQVLQQIELRARDHVHNREALLDQWRAYSLLTGRNVQIDSPGHRVAGICRGIDEEGALLIDDGQQQHRCVAGVVSRFDADPQ